MLIPPVSGRKAVRLRNADLITELLSLYSLLISAWISHDEANPGRLRFTLDNDTTKISFPPRRIRLHPQIRDLQRKCNNTTTELHEPLRWMLRVPSACTSTNLLRALQSSDSFIISTAWPIEEYFHLIDCESDMLVGLAQVSNSFLFAD